MSNDDCRMSNECILSIFIKKIERSETITRNSVCRHGLFCCSAVDKSRLQRDSLINIDPIIGATDFIETETSTSGVSNGGNRSDIQINMDLMRGDRNKIDRMP